jgi:hypothetical protein
MQSLSKETHLDAQDYLSKGYATKIIDNASFAQKKDKLTNNNNTMNEDKTNILMEKIDKIFSFLSDRKVMNIVLQSIDGIQLEFPDLTDGQTPKVGDTVNINGQPANGEFKMEDGSIYECIDGKLFEIYTADMQMDKITENEALKSSVELLKTENESLNRVLENSKKDVLELKEKVSAIMNERSKNIVENNKQDQKNQFKKRKL